MKCSRCSKPATLHITEIRHGTVQAVHLCESCAQEYLSSSSLNEVADPADQLAAQLGQLDEGELREYDDLVCPNCGLTFREFRQQGRLGCPHDYVAFEEELMPLLENIHGETQHVGKFPKRAPHESQRQYELIRLRNQLRSAVEDEQYEEAARLRDEIQTLESALKAAKHPRESVGED